MIRTRYTGEMSLCIKKIQSMSTEVSIRTVEANIIRRTTIATGREELGVRREANTVGMKNVSTEHQALDLEDLPEVDSIPAQTTKPIIIDRQ